MRPPSLRWALFGGAAGGLVALALLVGLGYTAGLPTLDAYVTLHRVRALFWPFSILLLGTAGREMTLGGLLILAASIAGNVFLYGVIVGFASTFRRRAPAMSRLPDGTTR